MTDPRLFTGNRFVALPNILKRNSGILDISFVSLRSRAVIELTGTAETPFLEPLISVAGQQIDISKAEWQHEMHWLPTFVVSERNLCVRSRVFAALAHRGFVWTMELESLASDPMEIEVGWQGHWVDTRHVISVPKLLNGERVGGVSPMGGGTAFAEFRAVAPMFAVAFTTSEPMETLITSDCDLEKKVTCCEDGEVAARVGESVCYRLSKKLTLAPGAEQTVTLYVGLGPEEISAISTATDLKQHTWQTLLAELRQWLAEHSLKVDNKKLNRVLNCNSLYNYFFSEAFTLDTEELVLLTARSSAHSVSAGYRDRDAMLWSLPAALQIEPMQARRMIEYALTKQLQNVGVNSRFVDGVVLESGFALDQLCAPIRALTMYVRATSDISILFDNRVQTGINRIRKILGSKKLNDFALFETTLLPSNRPAKHPIVTYDNVLAWRVLKDMEWMYELIHDLDRSEQHKQRAKNVHQAILDNCVVAGPYGPMFALSVDLKGEYEIGDDPSGSLLLLSWLEFCAPDFPTYKNTAKWIYSSMNPDSFHDAPFAVPGEATQGHPSVVAIANDLLAGRVAAALDILERAEMDDGIASETIDPNTGKAVHGRAFASGAGYLAFALGQALAARVFGPEPEPTDKLYEPPPAEIQDSIDASRLH